MKKHLSLFSFLAFILFQRILFAQVTRDSLQALKPNLLRNFRSSAFKDAYHELQDIADKNPGNATLSDFFCDLTLSRSNSENASKAFQLWTTYLEGMSPETLYKSATLESLKTNTLNSPPDKYPPIRSFLLKLGQRQPADDRFYDLLSELGKDDHPRTSEMIAEIYSELLRDKSSAEEAKKHLERFLKKTKKHLRLRTEILLRLAKVKYPPNDTLNESALELADNSNSLAEKVLLYLNYVAAEHPETLKKYESSLLTSLHSCILEPGNGELSNRSAELLATAPHWIQDKAALQALLKSFLQKEASPAAQRAASSALDKWNTTHKVFFNDIFDVELKTLSSFFVSKPGNSITRRNCLRFLKNQ